MLAIPHAICGLDLATLFISDLHLDASHSEIGDQFAVFAADRARSADALYILGDLFEYWVGDDDPQPERQRVAAALRMLSEHGVPSYVMRGNRDFMLDEKYMAECGATLLADEVVLELHGERLLIMHGDSLCTDDHEYQAFRTQTRDPLWKQQMRAKPLDTRLAMARQARAHSQQQHANAPENITDVNQGAVEEAMRRHGVTRLLHGHTHRPAVHDLQVDGKSAQRVVLGDWYEQGSVVAWSAAGLELEFLPRA